MKINMQIIGNAEAAIFLIAHIYRKCQSIKVVNVPLFLLFVIGRRMFMHY